MLQMGSFIFAVSLVFIASCAPKETNKRSRPTDQIEETSAYLESTETDIAAAVGGKATIGKTTVQFPPDATASDYRVRLSRSAQTPELSVSETAVLGSPQADIVTVEVYDVATNVVLSSDQLSAPYEFKQSFSTSSPTDKIGLMIVSDAGTAVEQRTFLPNSELTVSSEANLNLSQSLTVTIRVNLKLTNAVVWLAPYTENTLKVLTIGKASSVGSIGGSNVSPISTTPASSIPDAALSINSGSSYTTSPSVTLSLTATGATEVYVTGASGCTSEGVWENFSTSKSWTLSALNAVSRVYAKFRTSDGSESSCVSSSIIHDDASPSAPGSVDDGTTNASLTSSPVIGWLASADGGSGVSRYEIAIGTSAGGIDVKTWMTVGNATSGSLSGLSLTADETYYASVRAVDAAGNVSSVTEGDGWTATAPPINCPANFVAIPANSALSTDAFCVMKYEAKVYNVTDGIAVADGGSLNGAKTYRADSRPDGKPWLNLVRGTDATTPNSAWKACATAGYNLLTNAQWQAIARNIETAQSSPGVYRNWSNGSTSGANALNRGHSDDAPAGALEADTTGDPDDDPCVGTGQTNCANQTVNLAESTEVASYSQKRTHTLSNGQIIWDIAGNVWEWVQDSLTNQGSNDAISQNPGNVPDPTTGILRWGPSTDFTLKRPAHLGGAGGSEYGGLGYGALNGSDGAVVRGGFSNSLTGAGVFAADLNRAPTSPYANVGFRCAVAGGS